MTLGTGNGKFFVWFDNPVLKWERKDWSMLLASYLLPDTGLWFLTTLALFFAATKLLAPLERG